MQEQSRTISLLEAVKKFVQQYPDIAELDLHYDQTEAEPVNYSIQTSGLVKLSEDILGDQTWQYNALLQSREYTADDISRLNASEFSEHFIWWVEYQNMTHNFPDLDSGLKPTKISADNGMLLALDDDGDRGIYQIQLHLTFNKTLI